MIPITSIIGEKGNQSCMSEISLDRVSYYACEDADIAFQIFNLQKNKIKELCLENLFYNIEIPLIKVLIEMEYNGVFVDINLIKNLSIQLKIQIKNLSEKIYSITNKEFNLNSPKQLAAILYDDLQLKMFKKRSTSAEALIKLKKFHDTPRAFFTLF